MQINLTSVNSFRWFQLIRFGFLLLTGILLSNSSLSMQEIGVYESLLLLSGAISFFWVSGTLNSLLSVTGHKERNEKDAHLLPAFIILCLWSVIVFMLLHAFKPHLSEWFGTSGEKIFRVFAVYVLLNCITFLNEYILLIYSLHKRLLTYGIFSGCTAMLCVMLPVWAGKPLETVFTLLSVLAFLKLVFLFFQLRLFAAPGFSAAGIKTHLIISLPLTASLLLSGACDYIDGIMVTNFFGKDEFAVFRYGAREFPLALIFASALSTSLIPLLAADAAKGMELIKKESLRLMHIFFPAGIAFMFISPWVYEKVFSERFIASAEVFNIYLLLLISRFLFPQTILISNKKNKVQLLASLIEITVNIVSSLLLMNHFGIAGIAYGTILAFCSEKLFLILYLHFGERISLLRYHEIKWWLIWSLLLVSAYVCTVSFF